MGLQVRLLPALATLALLCPAAGAQAYLDPGTGSIILQMLLGGVAGGLIIGKLYWERLRMFFGGLFSGANGPSDNESDE